MAKTNENTICILDVGSTKTCVIVGEITEGGLRYRGHGITESRGTRKGAIVELEKATASIQRAVEEAEDSSEIAIEHATVGIGGPHVRGFNSRGGIALGTRPREINRDDIRQAVERARSVSLPPDRQTIHLLPQEFIVDEQGSIQDPAGMIGLRLEVNAHVVTAAAGATQNLVTAANRAGIHVDDVVFEPLGCADAVLDPDERELGICLVDIGAGSSEVVVFYEGAVAHTGVVPVGGDHFTNDVAVGLRTPLADAEKIKRMFGAAVVTSVPEGNEIEVPSVGERPSRLMSQRTLGEILEPRARELFEMLREQLRQAGVLEALGSGCVLTGGASRLPAIAEIGEQILRCPTRLG
ncbi:MAG: cell division protein FtsA, partial [Acidobacteria bacterium]|nr:cell division protein FtsA [Acidobacteriota bacterium]